MERVEKDLEAKVGRWVRQNGGLWLKWVSPGYTGVPDRILMAAGGLVAFAEMKQKTGRVSGRQRYVCDMLRRFGFRVYVVHDEDQARAMLREVMGVEVQAT